MYKLSPLLYRLYRPIITVLILASITALSIALHQEHLIIIEKNGHVLDCDTDSSSQYLEPEKGVWTPYVVNYLPAVVHHGDANGNRIALTFDDGPRPESTEKILDILESFGVRATFFVVGSQAEKHPDLLRAIYTRGHEVGNHTYSHTRLAGVPASVMTEELEKTRTVIFNYTGFVPFLFRPPGGQYDDDVLMVARDLNYTTVLWTNNSGDWQDIKEEELIARVVNNTQTGAIILMHTSGNLVTVRALPTIITRLKSKGFSFSTISELYPVVKDGFVRQIAYRDIE